MSRRLLLVAILLAIPTIAPAQDQNPEVLMEASHWKRVRAAAEARIKSNTNDAYANYLMARVKMAFNDPDAALPFAEKAVALDAKNADYRYALAGAAGQKAERAGVFSQFGLARRFKKEAETTIQLNPNHIDARLGLIEYHLRAPGIIGGDKKKVPALAEEVMRIDPSRGYLLKPRLAQAEKQKDPPIESWLLKAVESNPRSYRAHISLADFYANSAAKKFDLAEKEVRVALALDPGRANAYSFLASLFAYQERWNDLDTILAQAERAVPDNLNPYFQAGRNLFTNGKDLPRAERYFRKYLTQEPEGGAPTLAAAHWRLGLTLEKMGRKPDALAELQTAVRMDPDNDAFKKDLKRLK